MVTVLTASLVIRPDALAVTAIISAIHSSPYPGTTLTLKVIVPVATPMHALAMTMPVAMAVGMPVTTTIPGLMDPGPFNPVMIRMAAVIRRDSQACGCANQPTDLCSVPATDMLSDGSTNHGTKQCAGNAFDIPLPGVGCTRADQCNSRHRQGCQVPANRGPSSSKRKLAHGDFLLSLFVPIQRTDQGSGRTGSAKICNSM